MTRQPLLSEPSLDRRLVRAVDGPRGTRCFEIEYAAGVRVPQHRHAEAYLCCVLDGGVEETYRGQERRATFGETLVYAPRARHGGRLAPRATRIFHLEVAASDTHDWLPEEAWSADRRPARVDGRWALQLRHEVLHGGPTPGLEASCLVVEALAEATGWKQAPARPGAWVERVKERVLDDLESRPTLDELARLAGLHRSHMARSFRRLTGWTIGELRRRHQVARAADCLRRGDLPLAEIALRAGFSDQSHLGRVFRRATGWTPMAYRRRCRRGG